MDLLLWGTMWWPLTKGRETSFLWFSQKSFGKSSQHSNKKVYICFIFCMFFGSSSCSLILRFSATIWSLWIFPAIFPFYEEYLENEFLWKEKNISEIDSGRTYPISFDVDCIPHHLEMFCPRMEFPNKDHNLDWDEGLL